MRITVVGPAHPIKGGISQHTTVLAQRLSAAGHDVQIVSWLRQYPRRLYPGQQTVERPELAPFEPTLRSLSWNRPGSWVRTGRRLRDVDLVVFAHVTSIQVVPYLAMIAALRRGSARVVVLCHNVLPHERRRVDESLVARLLGAADGVVVHSAAEAVQARALTPTSVAVARMAPHLPRAFVRSTPLPGEHRRLIFFGLVRPYKGLDVLLRALAAGPPDVALRVVGEFWGGTGGTERLCRELGIAGRVEISDGYAAAEDVPALFSDVDALVLPYRNATGSQAVWAGFEFGVPVIATRTGHLADDIRDGVDGLTAQPGEVASLGDALRRFYAPGVPERMRAEVSPVDSQPYWDRYVQVLLDVAHVEQGAHDERMGMAEAAPPGGKLLQLAKLGAEQALWARVGAQRAWSARSGRQRALPSPVAATDVLSTVAEYERCVAECRRLGLPRHRDRPKNWDALGAVSTVLNELGRDIRVIDAGAARYSSILPWLRLYDVRELVGNNLEFSRVTKHGPVSFEPGDITATKYEDGSFDAVTCMSVIEHGVPLDGFARESARILRPGGLLVVSTDYDQQPPDTTGKTAYGAPVKIFGPEEIRGLVKTAESHGLQLVGDLRLEHAQRPVHWRRTGLNYTFIRLTFRRQ